MERTLHHVGVVHIHNAVLNCVVVLVEYVAHCLAAVIVRADFGAAVVAALTDNFLNRAVALKAHGVLYGLCNKARAYKTAGTELAHAETLKQIAVFVSQCDFGAGVGRIGIESAFVCRS